MIETDCLERAFVFGGAYGNLQATEAMLAKAQGLGFAPNEVIFTGDLVAYCGQPQETVDTVRTFGCRIIQGNCEEALAAGSDNCGCGFEENSACSILSDQWFEFCACNLDDQTKRWMGTLPRSLELDIGGFRFLVTHGTPERINQFVFPSDFEHSRYKTPSNPAIDGYIVGHSGIPFIGQTENHIWLNSGAAGMPANDGTDRVWYATLEHREAGMLAETHPLTYDVRGAQNAMKCAGLENGYKDCLESGRWPSLDVLPEQEKDASGQSISQEKRAFRRAPLAKAVA